MWLLDYRRDADRPCRRQLLQFLGSWVDDYAG